MISVDFGQPLQPSDSEKETGNQGSQKSAKNKKELGKKSIQQNNKTPDTNLE